MLWPPLRYLRCSSGGGGGGWGGQLGYKISFTGPRSLQLGLLRTALAQLLNSPVPGAYLATLGCLSAAVPSLCALAAALSDALLPPMPPPTPPTPPGVAGGGGGRPAGGLGPSDVVVVPRSAASVLLLVRHRCGVCLSFQRHQM